MEKEKRMRITPQNLREIQNVPIKTVDYFLLPRVLAKILLAGAVPAFFFYTFWGIKGVIGAYLLTAYFFYEKDYKQFPAKYPKYLEEKTILSRFLRLVERIKD